MTEPAPDLSALDLAARTAIAYRLATAAAERTPVADYAAIHAAFASPLPEQGGTRPRSLPNWPSVPPPASVRRRGRAFSAG